MVCTCEIAGRVRGKGFPAGELASRLVKGVGWVPTNTMISALGPIADTPFGATGDMILVPDPATEVNVDFGDGGAAEHWFLGDIRLTDGTPWECCPRRFPAPRSGGARGGGRPAALRAPSSTSWSMTASSSCRARPIASTPIAGRASLARC